MSKRSLWSALLPSIRLLTLLTLVLGTCFGQMDTGTVSGRVTDVSGAVVPGVRVVMESAERGTSQETVTNASGIYVFPAVRPGPYNISIQKQGFKGIAAPNLTVNVQSHIEQNFVLQVGAVSESVTVTGEDTTINTQSPAVSTVVDDRFVQNMPLNGRSFQSLIQLTPGVVVDASMTSQGQLSVNGQRTDANYFSVDGVSANVSGIGVSGNLPGYTIGGGTNGLVSVDAMQEFRIQTSTYAPEFGRSPGAQISIVTKSGSNDWHGSVFDYIRNGVFDARNYFDVAEPAYGNPALPKPDTHQNDFGGTLSGPIWKDHTFFFFSYEGLRAEVPATNSGNYFYDSDAKAALAASPTAGTWKAVVAATPTGTGQLLDPTCDNITNPCQRELSAAYSDPSSFDVYSLRVDHKLNSKVTIFGRYNHAPSSSNVYYYNNGQPSWANTDTLTVGVTAALSPTTVNDFRANWSRQTGGQTYTNEATFGAVNPPLSAVIPPGISTQNFSVVYALGDAGSAQWGQTLIETQRQLNFVDTVSKSVGAHQLKFGADLRRMQPTQLSLPTFFSLSFDWTSILNGISGLTENGTADAITAHIFNFSLFAQDTWKITPRLTLTYGLRWDINTPPASDTAGKPLYVVEGVFNSAPLALGPPGKLWNTQLDAFAPRVGAAFQVTPKTVVRGGFGLFYDLGYGFGANGIVGGTFPYKRNSLFFGIPLDFAYQDPATGLYPYQPLPPTTQIGPEANQLQAVDPNLRLPVTYEWNAAFERQLGTNQSITATYVGAYGVNLLSDVAIAPPGVSQGIYAQYNASSSRYNALQVQFMRRMSHGLQAMINYTYSRSFDNDSGGYGLGTGPFPSISSVQLPPMTPSVYDVPQKFSAALSYNFPTVNGSGEALKKITEGWSLDGLYRYQCCAPLTVTIGVVNPAFGYTTVIASEVPGQPVWISDPSQPLGKALNPAAFTLANNGESDDALRSSLRSPYAISQIDLALRRQFNLSERVKLDVRAEVFNLLNHPMFGGVDAPNTLWGNCNSNTPASCTDPNPSFGSTTAYGTPTLNYALRTTNGSFTSQGQSPLYAVGGPRSCQFSLKLSF